MSSSGAPQALLLDQDLRKGFFTIDENSKEDK
jgi:hypothetical protein